MKRSASFSRDRRYRYELGRRWGLGPAVTWVMLNPSTADATVDDPTIRRCIDFSRSWGFGALRVVNLFALRTPEPSALLHVDDLLGPGGDRRLREVLRAVLRAADEVVVAWGNVHPRLGARVEAIASLLPAETSCLGLTARGEPRHPLYVRGDTRRVPFGEALSVFRATRTMAA
ncbi:MAG: DUF1643 domain-containing protein [Dehalococcoidia bacterium]|nr:DUF1643 domain-containing protein [Dehalococcoidia bacterium]